MQVKVGDIVEGKVTGITGFGAFIDLGEGQTGMVHISEVSYNFINNINEVLKVNDKVKAKVTAISDEGKISLSIKKSEERKPVKRTPPPVDNSFVWTQSKQEGTFEEMLSKFKQTSDEKISTLKRKNNDSRRGKRQR